MALLFYWYSTGVLEKIGQTYNILQNKNKITICMENGNSRHAQTSSLLITPVATTIFQQFAMKAS